MSIPWSSSVAVEEADDNGDSFDADDVLEELSAPTLDLSVDTLALWHGERMVGCTKVWTRPDAIDVDRIRISGAIHPAWRRRGLGCLLLDWGCERARAAHAEHNPEVPGEYRLVANLANEGATALYASAGFAPSRYHVGMERDLSLEIPSADAPEELRVVPFDPAYDEATRVARNQAFRDHWGSNPRDQAFWRQWVTGSRAFRAPMSRLALHGDEVAAYVVGYEFVAETAASGVRELHVGQVGTRRPYRGRGVARALLADVLAAAVAEGYERASLGVDADNPTGALGLYERIGFVARRKFVIYSGTM